MLIRTEVRLNSNAYDSILYIPISIVLKSHFMRDFLCTKVAEDVSDCVVANNIIPVDVEDIKEVILGKLESEPIDPKILHRLTTIFNEYFKMQNVIIENRSIHTVVSESDNDTAKFEIATVHENGEDVLRFDFVDIHEQYYSLDLDLKVRPKENCVFKIRED